MAACAHIRYVDACLSCRHRRMGQEWPGPDECLLTQQDGTHSHIVHTNLGAHSHIVHTNLGAHVDQWAADGRYHPAVFRCASKT